MIQKDGIAQWLAGDDLKQDQFKFIYNTMRVMYMSALKEPLLNEDPRVLEFVLPNLCAFRAIKKAKEISILKNTTMKKEAEKSTRSDGKRINTASLNVTVLQGGVS